VAELSAHNWDFPVLITLKGQFPTEDACLTLTHSSDSRAN
jgi:hypothetical protein